MGVQMATSYKTPPASPSPPAQAHTRQRWLSAARKQQ